MSTPSPKPSPLTSSLVRGLVPPVFIGIVVLGWALVTHQPGFGNLVAGVIIGVALVARMMLLFTALGRRPSRWPRTVGGYDHHPLRGDRRSPSTSRVRTRCCSDPIGRWS
jgi:hypothetical protein